MYISLFHSSDMFLCIRHHQGGKHHIIIQNIKMHMSLMMANAPKHVGGVE
jgi:hypothetical protein